MNNNGRLLITLLVLIYVLSPTDLLPGPVDDIVVMMLGHMLKQRSIKSYK